MGWRTRKDGRHYNTDKKVRNVSDDDGVEVNVNIENVDELESFAREKAKAMEEEPKLSKMQQDIVDKLNNGSILSEKDVNYIKNTLN